MQLMQLRRKLTIFLATAFVCGLFATTGFAAQKATLQGRVASGQQVQFDIYLPLQHRAQLETLLAALHDPASPRYHQWLTPDEFNRQFGAERERCLQYPQRAARLWIDR